MEPERRTAQRLRPNELSYVELGDEIGGMVRDASEKGLGFQAVAGVQAGRPFKLRISPKPACRIELLGTVVWTDQSKKSGGLQFAELSEDTRERIRAWLASGPAPAIEDEGMAPPLLPKEESVATRSNDELKTDNSLPGIEVSHDAHPKRATVDKTATPLLAPFSPTTFVQESLLPEGALFLPRSRRLNGFSITLLVVGILLAPIVVFPNLRAASGGALIRLGEKLKGNSQGQTAGAPSSSIQSSSQVSTVTPPPARLHAESPSAESPEKPVSPTPMQDAGGISNPPQTRYSKRGQIAVPFAVVPSRNHRSPLAQRLWSSISAGDVTAEIALAQLYLTGDGVPRSCEQARVLLKAASKSGNTDATQQLHSLKKRGCR